MQEFFIKALFLIVILAVGAYYAVDGYYWHKCPKCKKPDGLEEGEVREGFRLGSTRIRKQLMTCKYCGHAFWKRWRSKGR